MHVGPFGIDTPHHGEAGVEQLLAVSHLSSNKGNGHSMPLTSAEDTHRQLPHQCLRIGSALTGNHHIGSLEHVVETDGIEQQVDARLLSRTEILHESIAQSTGSTGARRLAAVVSEMF